MKPNQCSSCGGFCKKSGCERGNVKPTRKRTQVKLTDDEMKKIWYAMQNIMGWYSFQEVARAIEVAHDIKE